MASIGWCLFHVSKGSLNLSQNAVLIIAIYTKARLLLRLIIKAHGAETS